MIAHTQWSEMTGLSEQWLIWGICALFIVTILVLHWWLGDIRR